MTASSDYPVLGHMLWTWQCCQFHQDLSRGDAVKGQETTAHTEAEVLLAPIAPMGESLIWYLPELLHKPDHDPGVMPGEPKDAESSGSRGLHCQQLPCLL